MFSIFSNMLKPNEYPKFHHPLGRARWGPYRASWCDKPERFASWTNLGINPEILRVIEPTIKYMA